LSVSVKFAIILFITGKCPSTIHPEADALYAVNRKKGNWNGNRRDSPLRKKGRKGGQSFAGVKPVALKAKTVGLPGPTLLLLPLNVPESVM